MKAIALVVIADASAKAIIIKGNFLVILMSVSITTLAFYNWICEMLTAKLSVDKKCDLGRCESKMDRMELSKCDSEFYISDISLFYDEGGVPGEWFGSNDLR